MPGPDPAQVPDQEPEPVPRPEPLIGDDASEGPALTQSQTQVGWAPPPPVPAPEEGGHRLGILKPIIILAACLLLASAALGFYLAWDKNPAQSRNNSAVTLPLKPDQSPKGD